MRLLAVADLHYSLPQFDWVLEVAPDFDVVVLAGDLLELSSIVDRRAQAVVIRKYFERLRAVTPLVICSGNHDLDSPHESGEKVAKWLAASPDDGIITDGESIQLDGVLITVCPWWDGPITRAGPRTPSARSRRAIPQRATANAARWSMRAIRSSRVNRRPRRKGRSAAVGKTFCRSLCVGNGRRLRFCSQ